MTEPEVKVRFTAWPDPPNTAYVVTAIVQALRPCEGCGYEWGTYGRTTITEDELKNNGFKMLFLGGIQDSQHPLIQAKREIAKTKALEFFKTPMKSCSRCSCVDDQHRGTECKCCHAMRHCCSHHCCCFYRCSCRHAQEEHSGDGKCTFDDNCRCEKYDGEKR